MMPHARTWSRAHFCLLALQLMRGDGPLHMRVLTSRHAASEQKRAGAPLLCQRPPGPVWPPAAVHRLSGISNALFVCLETSLA